LTEQGLRLPVTPPFRDIERGKPHMLLTIAIILLILWALGFIGGYVVAWWIHLLLIIAIVILIWNFIVGRRAV
jgi:Family of unknown function (DUF5670)